MIKAINVAKGIKTITKPHPCTLEDVKKLLLIWINEKQLAGDTVTKGIICEKARALYNGLKTKLPGPSVTDKKSFKRSRGWFKNFKCHLAWGGCERRHQGSRGIRQRVRKACGFRVLCATASFQLLRDWAFLEEDAQEDLYHC
ncbi:tigger transposable element-derived 1-like [Pelobates cultripes]|uniref:Tigger transposable element-derived 1-like n=1 Tax=Pelobates cultripes TaxID=61616 RepID=A0AAD1R3S4_PELCU|nr:tigger transposable element-derived 1-like [Pelobates cultripes]